jgi:hypothetical protein
MVKANNLKSKLVTRYHDKKAQYVKLEDAFNEFMLELGDVEVVSVSALEHGVFVVWAGMELNDSNELNKLKEGAEDENSKN